MDDQDLDAILIGGREPVARVPMHDYDPEWPARYDRERAKLAAVLAGIALDIHHVGSTAVPGLAAKPVVDICVVVPDPEDDSRLLPRLEAAGYELRVREAGHRMYRNGDRTVQVHLYGLGSPEVDAYLVLRDWLRTHPDDRDLYAATKRSLALRSWKDINHYAEAKSEVIGAILGRARRPTSHEH